MLDNLVLAGEGDEEIKRIAVVDRSFKRSRVAFVFLISETINMTVNAAMVATRTRTVTLCLLIGFRVFFIIQKPETGIME